MTEEEMNRVIERIMNEIRESPDYLGHACSANKDSQCSHEESCSQENPKRLKKGIYCGIKPHCEKNQMINEGN